MSDHREVLTDNTPPGITDEMIEATAQHCWHIDAEQFADFPLSDWAKVDPPNRERYYAAARTILAAALAGRTVVQLPTPIANGDYETNYSSVWVDGAYRVASAFGSLRPEIAEDYGAALIAAAREARRLAAESSEGDPYPRYYRWGTSHFYRVDAPDRVMFRNDERNDWSGSGVETEAALLASDTATFERYAPESSAGGESRG